MCGRFVQAGPPEAYAEQLALPVAGAGGVAGAPHYNVAPTMPVLAIRCGTEGYEWVRLRWGLVPHWSKGPDRRFSMINARAETVAERAAFREPFRMRRCLIPADGFYEWRTECSGRQPYLITDRRHGAVFFAALWDHWHHDSDLIDSCTIIVTDANAAVAAIHDRMPVVIAPEDARVWLDPATPPTVLHSLLRPWPEEATSIRQVSRRVNTPQNDDPSLLEPSAP